MRFTYKIPPEDSVSFQTEYAGNLRKNIMPRWMARLPGLVFISAIFLVFVWFIDAVDNALALTFLVWLILWSCEKGSFFIYRKMAARYIASLPDSETWTCEVTDDQFVTGSRGLYYTFPLSKISRIYEKKEFLYIEFSTLGLARMPFGAFQSDSERCEFIRMLESKKEITEKTAMLHLPAS